MGGSLLCLCVLDDTKLYSGKRKKYNRERITCDDGGGATGYGGGGANL